MLGHIKLSKHQNNSPFLCIMIQNYISNHFILNAIQRQRNKIIRGVFKKHYLISKFRNKTMKQKNILMLLGTILLPINGHTMSSMPSNTETFVLVDTTTDTSIDSEILTPVIEPVLAPVYEMTSTSTCSSNAVTATVNSQLQESEKIISTTKKYWPSIDKCVVRTKISNTYSNSVREVAMDAVTLQTVSYDLTREEARTTNLIKNGKLSNDMIPIVSDTSLTSSIQINIELNDNIVLSNFKTYLSQIGFMNISSIGNTVSANGSSSAIKNLAFSDQVKVISLHEVQKNISLDIAADLGQAPLSAAHKNGLGTDILAAIWEIDACVLRNHKDFYNVKWEPKYGNSDCDVYGQAGHSTKVTGVFSANRGNDITSGLFQGRVLDVNSLDYDAVADMWSRNPDIVNASFTISRRNGKNIDEEVYRRGTFVFNGSGNDPEDEANCYSYNALCIGGYSANSTIGYFKDDTIWGASSTINDRYNNREFPQLVGPVVASKTASAFSQYASDIGTSYATPGVAGLGALLLASYEAKLNKRPALMRSVLMASAQAHSIVSEGKTIPDFNDGIDDKMGVGAPNGNRAKSILEQNSYQYKVLTPSDLGLQSDINIPVKLYDKVRVVLAWDQCPEYDKFDPELFVDLDMSVKVSNSSYPYLTSYNTYTNTSFSDNWEVIEFTAQSTGTAKINLSASRFNACGAENNQKRVRTAISWTTYSNEPKLKL